MLRLGNRPASLLSEFGLLVTIRRFSQEISDRVSTGDRSPL
jgi:hypothetical protein